MICMMLSPKTARISSISACVTGSAELKSNLMVMGGWFCGRRRVLALRQVQPEAHTASDATPSTGVVPSLAEVVGLASMPAKGRHDMRWAMSFLLAAYL